MVCDKCNPGPTARPVRGVAGPPGAASALAPDKPRPRKAPPPRGSVSSFRLRPAARAAPPGTCTSPRCGYCCPRCPRRCTWRRRSRQPRGRAFRWAAGGEGTGRGLQKQGWLRPGRGQALSKEGTGGLEGGATGQDPQPPRTTCGGAGGGGACVGPQTGQALWPHQVAEGAGCHVLHPCGPSSRPWAPGLASRAV